MSETDLPALTGEQKRWAFAAAALFLLVSHLLWSAAVNDLHRQHVIHLDLKPDNFLQRETGEMVLIDFGLSRHDHLPDLLAEEFTIPMGTFPYIAPEQYLRQRGDLRSDLYALGAMIYELATGKMPFGQPEKLSQVKQRLWRDPVPPRALVPQRQRQPSW